MFYGFVPTFIVLIPAILFTVYAQRKVQSAYATYSRVPTKRQIPGSQVARMILDNNGMGHVPIEMISGQLTDNYDPTKDEMHISEGTYNSSSIASFSFCKKFLVSRMPSNFFFIRKPMIRASSQIRLRSWLASQLCIIFWIQDFRHCSKPYILR